MSRLGICSSFHYGGLCDRSLDCVPVLRERRTHVASPARCSSVLDGGHDRYNLVAVSVFRTVLSASVHWDR